MSILRSYKRALARNRMQLEGFRQINKHGQTKSRAKKIAQGTKVSNSYFANHWREKLVSEKSKLKTA